MFCLQLNGGPQYQHNGCQTHRESSRYKGDEEEDGLVTQSGDCDYGYMPEMRDNECQTRESLFANAPPDVGAGVRKGVSVSPSPPKPPPPCGALRRTKGPPLPPAAAAAPMAGPPIGFTTFGYQNNRKPSEAANEHRFRAEAVIEVERFKKSPKHDSGGGGAGAGTGGGGGDDGRGSVRPYSVQSTKSAPDVIVTH